MLTLPLPPTKRPTSPFVVVDMNQLRIEPVMADLVEWARYLGETIVLPDLALLELTKSKEHWEATMRGSLRVLSRYPAGVALAQSPY